jgi:hypothetical protein
MKARTLLRAAGMAAGAAIGATSLYVAMRPRLRKDLRKKGISSESLGLIGHEMRHEAGEAAGEMRDFFAQETKAVARGPRRWLRRRMKAGQAAARASEQALSEA